MNERRNRRKFPIPPWLIIMFLIFGGPVVAKFWPLLLLILYLCFMAFMATRHHRNPNIFKGIVDWFNTGIMDPPAEENENSHLRKLATEAMQQAGHVGADWQLRLDDIGILMYEEGANPRIYRTAEIPTTASHVRPFIVLNQPAMEGGSGHGTVRFNLVDEDGNLRFTNRSRYRLKNGQNFVTPPTWLPIDDQNPHGKWVMQVTVGDQKFAMLDVDWMPVGGEVRTLFNGDGELDERMVRLMEKRTAKQTMSLDELLGDQVEEAPIKLGASR